MFSIILPMDLDRLEQFANTKRAYDEMKQPKEFIIPTRSYEELSRHLIKNRLMSNVQLIPYETEAGFNCSKALNIGVRHAAYDQVIITSPEVKPSPTVLDQLEPLRGQNVLCHVSDQDENGNLTSLIHAGYRDDSPAMYFLAMFNKKDIELINGWDEDFMKGYAYEDNDFGERWKRAGLPFVLKEDISAVHQYHPRGETIPSGLQTNFTKFNENTANGIVQPKNGLTVLL